MPSEPDAGRERRRRRATLVALLAIIVITPLGAHLATPRQQARLDADQIAKLPHVDGYVKEATSRRVVVEQQDGLFRNLEVGEHVSQKELAHLQDHARYGTPTRLAYVTRDGHDFVADVRDLEDFPGVERTPAREVEDVNLERIEVGDSRRRVLDVLGSPREVAFDHTAERDCWTWLIAGQNDARAEVCFSWDSRPRVVRVGRRDP